MQIIEKKGHYQIIFQYHPRIIEKVKELPDRRWSPSDKCWTVPVTHKGAIEIFAMKYGFQMGEQKETDIDYDVPELPDLEVYIPLKMDMYPYQAKGVAYNIKNRRVIIGDKPGLGKTVQAIATVTAADMLPCLVICPSSLKTNWQREWHMWTDKKAIVMDNRVKNTWDQFYDVGLAHTFIVNYESLKKFFVVKIDDPGVDKNGKKKPVRLNHIHFDQKINMFKSVIIDESHRVKEIKTLQTKFSKGICNGKEMILLATGTPVINKPKDLVSQLGILDQLKNFGGYKNFMTRYCSGPQNASNLKELGYKLRTTCFYQRDKKDVLKDLPDKTRQIIICEIDNRSEYDAAERDLMDYLIKYKDADEEKIERAMRGEIMVRIGILKNISARGKIRSVREYIQDLMDSDEKMILFGHLKDVINSLKEAFPKAVSVTGSDSMDERDRSVTAFQKCNTCGIRLDNHKNITDHEWEASDTNLILCSIKAAGVGLTLTASSHVGFIEFPWTAADCDQCEDRAHRIGQKDNVQCTYFLGQNTIDEKIYEIIQRKRKIAETITGTQEVIEESVIDDIINLFNQKA